MDVGRVRLMLWPVLPSLAVTLGVLVTQVLSAADNPWAQRGSVVGDESARHGWTLGRRLVRPVALLSLGFFLLFAVVVSPLPALATEDQWATSQPSGSEVPREVRCLAVSPDFSSDQTVFAGAQGVYNYAPLYKSADGGSSWSYAGPTDCTYIAALAFSPGYRTDRTIFAAGVGGVTGWGDHVYKSTDGGTTWTESDTGIGDPCATSFAISPNYVTDHTIFVSAEDANYANVVYKSTNGGADWSPASPGSWGASVYALAISPNFAVDRTIFATTAGSGVFKSTDGGSNWSRQTGLADDNAWAIAVSPSYASDQTVFAGESKSTDGGATWSLDS